ATATEVTHHSQRAPLRGPLFFVPQTTHRQLRRRRRELVRLRRPAPTPPTIRVARAPVRRLLTRVASESVDTHHSRLTGRRAARARWRHLARPAILPEPRRALTAAAAGVDPDELSEHRRRDAPPVAALTLRSRFANEVLHQVLDELGCNIGVGKP